MEFVEEKPEIYLLENNVGFRWREVCFETRASFPEDKRYWILDEEKWQRYKTEGVPHEPEDKTRSKLDYIFWVIDDTLSKISSDDAKAEEVVLPKNTQIYEVGNSLFIKSHGFCFKVHKNTKGLYLYEPITSLFWRSKISTGQKIEVSDKTKNFILDTLNALSDKYADQDEIDAEFAYKTTEDKNKSSSDVKKIRIFIHNHDKDEFTRLPEISVFDKITNINIYLPEPIRVKEDSKNKKKSWRNFLKF